MLGNSGIARLSGRLSQVGLPMTGKLYSAPEVASWLGVELDTLYRYARRGNLRGLKIGKLWRFAEADVEEFLQSRRYRSCQVEASPKLLPEILHQAGEKSGQTSGLVCSSVRMSYAEIDLLSDRLAAALVDRGLRPGDRVLTVLPNSVEFVIVCFAVWKARAIVVPEDSTVRLGNLLHILQDTQPAALVVDRNVATQLEEVREAPPSLRTIFIKDRTFALSGLGSIEVESLDAVLESEARVAPIALTGGSPAEAVSITYTSGSTGTPKGVVHTHESWLAGAAFTRDYLGVSATDKLVIPLPLHHAYAFRQILAYLLAGGTVVIAADIYQALKLMREERPTALLLVPAACNIMADHFASVLQGADSFLRYIEVGSAPLAPERLRGLRDLLPTTPIHLPYGLTEARVGFLQAGPDRRLNRISRLSPGLELKVVDTDGQPVAKGQTGEIGLRGTGLMKGYWHRPESEHLESGWFRTGDMGRLDENGEVALLGRIDQILKIGGRKVNPFEVELALNRHPAVAESAAVGLPDQQGIMEQELHAFVVPQKNRNPSVVELLAHCRQVLEPYKIPVRIHFLTSLPRSSVGKIQRHLLAAEQSLSVNKTLEETHASAD